MFTWKFAVKATAEPEPVIEQKLSFTQRCSIIFNSIKNVIPKIMAKTKKPGISFVVFLKKLILIFINLVRNKKIIFDFRIFL